MTSVVAANTLRGSAAVVGRIEAQMASSGSTVRRHDGVRGDGCCDTEAIMLKIGTRGVLCSGRMNVDLKV